MKQMELLIYFRQRFHKKQEEQLATGLWKNFGTLSQFDSKASIQNLLDTGGTAQVVELIKRLKLIENFDQYKVRGLFISNVGLDANGEAYLVITPTIEFIGKSILESTFISNERTVPQNQVAEFDIAGLNISKHYVDANTLAFIVPIKANELVKMPGIADQSVFAYNVRGPLGGTNVNRDIVKSIKDKNLHKKFPLFHNGITIVTNKIAELPDAASPEKLALDLLFCSFFSFLKSNLLILYSYFPSLFALWFLCLQEFLFYPKTDLYFLSLIRNYFDHFVSSSFKEI